MAANNANQDVEKAAAAAAAPAKEAAVEQSSFLSDFFKLICTYNAVFVLVLAPLLFLLLFTFAPADKVSEIC